MSAVLAALITGPDATLDCSRIADFSVAMNIAPARILMNCYFIHKLPVRQAPIREKSGLEVVGGGFSTLPAAMRHGSNHA
jgi:hypothetical protein